MQITYRVDCGRGVVIEKVVDRERIPMVGDNTNISQSYSNLCFKVDSIKDNMYNEEIIVFCELAINAHDDMIEHFEKDYNWSIISDERKNQDDL